MKMDREGLGAGGRVDITIALDQLVNRAFVLSASAHSRSWGHDMDGHIPAIRGTVLHPCLRADFELAFDFGFAVNHEFHYFSFPTLRDLR
jgi:hypothetical protein